MVPTHAVVSAMREPLVIWWDGDPYAMDNEGEYVEVHHGGRD
jgi:hypothetical protein